MNKKILFFTIVLHLFASITAFSQNWIIGGNAPGNNTRLGTNNNKPITFATNNINQGRLQADGKWGLGTINPTAQVHINSVNAVTSPLKIDIAGVPKMILDSIGRLGIGTSAPQSKLHISLGATGARPAANTVLTLENTGNSFINMLTPSSNESGVLFGNPSRFADGGMVYNSSSNLNGLDFRTNGNIARMTINSAGDVGIGTTPAPYKFKVCHNNFGFAIENAGSGNLWELLSSSAGLLQLFHNDKFVGEFDETSGEYRAISDARRKTNIQSMPAVLQKISELKPVVYQFKSAGDNKVYNGFIAQDVQKVFPSLVDHVINKERNLDTYTLNYSGFGILAIKGIQELMQINEEKNVKIESQQKQIDDLQKQIDELKAMMLKGSQSMTKEPVKTVSLSTASLAQNMPNPFSGSTTIQYTLPEKFTTAHVMITDKAGKTIKQINVSGRGKGRLQVDASTIAPGAYSYSLVVNGKVTDTRQMMVFK